MIVAIGVVLVTSLLAAIFYDLHRRARLAERIDRRDHDLRIAALRVRAKRKASARGSNIEKGL